MGAVSALVVAHNEADQLAECLERLTFADEVVVVLDRCTDGSAAVAGHFTERIVEGAWPIQGARRNAGIAACRGPWVLEVDADERVGAELAREIRAVVASSPHGWHRIPVDNYVGARRVRYGWGAYIGKSSYAGLFRKGNKVWGGQRVHPEVTMSGSQGPPLKARLDHFVDRDISDMLRRLDRYSSNHARDLVDGNVRETFSKNVRRMFTRFFKCYVSREGYREGPYGFLVALCAGLYPILSYLKATLEVAPERNG